MRKLWFGLILVSSAVLSLWLIGGEQEDVGSIASQVAQDEPVASVYRGNAQRGTSAPTTQQPDANDEATLSAQYAPKFATIISRRPLWRPVHSREAAQAADASDMVALTDKAFGGNPYAARLLSQIRERCAEAPKTVRELDDAINQFRQSRIYGETHTDGHLIADDEKSERVIRQMREAYEKCNVVSNRLENKDVDFLKLAADNGNPLAMVEYGDRIVSSDLPRARKYYEESWKQGVIFALKSLSEVERLRFENGTDPEGNVSAAAYFLAFVALHEARSVRRGQRMPSAFFTQTSAQLADLIESLPPYQRPIAEDLAKQIINSNEACCFQ